MQPGAKRCPAVEAANFTPRPQESLLNHIFRVCFVSRHTIGEPEYSCGVALDEHTKRVAIPAARLFQGVIIAIIHPADSLDCQRASLLVRSLELVR
jgi:hypothetical protein